MSVLSSESIRRANAQTRGTKSHTLTERTFLTADGKAVPAGHPDGVQLLGNVGKKLPLDVAREFGLVEAKASEFPKHAGGGWYDLSDGSRVQGKDDAIAAEKALATAEDKEQSTPENKSD